MSLPNQPSRRHLLAALAGFAGVAGRTEQSHALPVRQLEFPRDRGAHPEFRTEWWYITGHAETAAPGGREFGFQLTFFRSRVADTQAMASKFAARQLVFAHAAVTDVQGKKLWHDQRIARASFGIALASDSDMDLKLRDWSLKAEGANYAAELPAPGFAIQLRFQETQGLLLQGRQGLSRKGPDEKQASYYYSQPQLAARGSLRIGEARFDVAGKAWLDHEWSDEVLHASAVGWDWIGMNLDDGGALTAFRLRDREGNAVWDGGSFRSSAGELRIFNRGEVIFQPTRSWTSPLSRTRYPVQWHVTTPVASYGVAAVIDDQELDSRNSTGSIYWEGLSRLLDSQGRRVGTGYLEMTGYAEALRL